MQYISTTIANLASIPIRIYENNKQTFYYSTINLPIDPITINLVDVLNINEHIGYYITDDFLYYGIVNSNSTKIIIGPSYTNITDQTIKKHLYSYHNFSS